MIDISVQYTGERQQFGKRSVLSRRSSTTWPTWRYKLEYAKAPVHRAAYSIANKEGIAGHAVSHAKLAACEAANLAAKNSIQVHGAMGYTWEVDLHIFMKKAWALANTWGDAGFTRRGWRSTFLRMVPDWVPAQLSQLIVGSNLFAN